MGVPLPKRGLGPFLLLRGMVHSDNPREWRRDVSRGKESEGPKGTMLDRRDPHLVDDRTPHRRVDVDDRSPSL